MSGPILEFLDAVDEGDCQRMDSLIASGVDVHSIEKGDEWNFLHKALVSVVIPPNAKSIKHLIDLSVDVNSRDRLGWTPLLFAVRTGNCEVVKLLVDAGADLDAVNDEGICPLHQCLLTNPFSLTMFEMLLAAGADPDNERGCVTVRHYASKIWKPEIDAIRELLEKYPKN